MDQLQRILMTIRSGLGRLGPTEQMLIGSMCVILVMGLFLVSQYAGSAKLAPLFPGVTLTEPQREEYTAVLTSFGAPVKSGPSGEILVPAEQATALRGRLAESGRTPADTSIMFDTLIEKQSWTASREENHRNYIIAKGNELARHIREGFNGVNRVGIVLEESPASGLGRAAAKPTASVTITTTAGQQLTQRNVDGIAMLISGAVPRLRPTDVSIVVNGVHRKASDPDEIVPGTALEYRQTYERLKEEKIRQQFGYITGLEVWVTVDADVARVLSRSTQYSRPVTAPVSETTTETTQTQAQRGAEPGARPNTGLSINRGGGSGMESSSTTEETTFESRFGERVEEKVDPGGAVKRAAASIAVPEDWVRETLLEERRRGGDEAPAQPTAEEVGARYEAEREKIVDSVRPHLLPHGDDAADVDSVLVQVAMVPRRLEKSAGGGDGGVGGGAGSAGQSLVPGLGAMGPLVDKMVLGGLALVSVGLMFMMVRRASRRATLPTAEELAGVPQTLHGETDLIGEADESEAAMAGIEVDDDQIHTQRMLEQVTHLVGERPEAVASLIANWLAADE
jgi:flagellar biosynthesis/type III secretory pathway M-ring protein FliF/YscJ